jgi:hypothetical protein
MSDDAAAPMSDALLALIKKKNVVIFGKDGCKLADTKLADTKPTPQKCSHSRLSHPRCESDTKTNAGCPPR